MIRVQPQNVALVMLPAQPREIPLYVTREWQRTFELMAAALNQQQALIAALTARVMALES